MGSDEISFHSANQSAVALYCKLADASLRLTVLMPPTVVGSRPCGGTVHRSWGSIVNAKQWKPTSQVRLIPLAVSSRAALISIGPCCRES